MRTACDIVLEDKERRTLQRCSRGRSTPARLALRSRSVLLAAKGLMNKDIAKEVGTSRQSVGLWRSRFVEGRLRHIDHDAPRGGRKPTRRDRVAHLLAERTIRTVPLNTTYWSVRTLGKALGISPTMVHRVWKANGLKSQRGWRVCTIVRSFLPPQAGWRRRTSRNAATISGTVSLGECRSGRVDRRCHESRDFY